MIVIKAVMDDPPLFSIFEDAVLSQDSKLMGNSGLGHAYKVRKIAHAKLFNRESFYNPNSGRVGERLEYFSDLVSFRFVGKPLTNVSHSFFVGENSFANVVYSFSFDHRF